MSKRLYRSRNDRILAGVCGGIADYFGIDTSLVRIAWVIFTLMGGAGIIAYIICAIVFPEGSSYNTALNDDEYVVGAKNYDDKYEHYYGKENGENDKNRILIGTILIVLGVLFLIKKYVYWFDLGKLWPVALIILGAFIIFKKREEN
ncbi:PspC domain-containing protein [Paramaledivibacter caminithermalis]|uniref:Phage shock protein C (PspC) family protein n=1 Tax=Paramaledivibacter caminithermalis (strain DSM 15212 / CIP 107654 / DViRD3) TaxID=1121301 RepID=A0A1M6LDS3_PARC5|nr:PspC domain-containing protein [Paramaledivibacter caminithermalis]SHJ69369.1 phage shock protein C (PspC) family protein [Paramaledivibacter caminithermalis DSM 15212]